MQPRGRARLRGSAHAPRWWSSHRQVHELRQPIAAPQIDGSAFRPGWLVNSRLLQLAESGRIGRTELDAAARWRSWLEAAARLRVQPWTVRVDSSLGDHGSVTQQRRDAVPGCGLPVRRWGRDRLMLLHFCVIEDRSWQAIATRVRLSDKTAQTRTIEALAALAAYLAGQPVPPPPGVRFRNQPGSW